MNINYVFCMGQSSGSLQKIFFLGHSPTCIDIYCVFSMGQSSGSLQKIYVRWGFFLGHSSTCITINFVCVL